MVTIASVKFSKNKIIVKMSDGNTVESPINTYPNLSKGTPNQLAGYEIRGGGKYIHWEELDEDLSAEGFLSIT